MTYDNSQQMLNTSIPGLCSFSFLGLFGSRGVGKSYQMLRICKSYEDEANKTKFDLNQPQSNKGKITDIFFLTPNVNSDLTLRNDENMNSKILIDGNDDNIVTLSQNITQYAQDVALVLQSQTLIRDFLKSKPIQNFLDSIKEQMRSINKDSIQDPLFKNISNQFKAIMKFMTRKYGEYISVANLAVYESDQELLKYETLFTQLFEIDFKGFWLRKQKIIIMLDDLSGSTLFTNITKNPFFEMVKKGRHLGCWSIMMAIQGVSHVYNNFRCLMTSMLLFSGLKQEQVILMFENITSLQSPSFGPNEFLDLYRKQIGYYCENFKEKQKYFHNFLYLVLAPAREIWLNFDKQVK